MRGREARIALAGPISMIAAMLGVAVSIALSDLPPALAVAVLAVLPVGLCFWVCGDISVGARVLLGVINLAISAGVLATLLGVARFGMTALVGIVVMLGSATVVLIGSFVARRRSGGPLFGRWFLWWALAVAGLISTQPLAMAVTSLAGVDAMAGLAMFLAPTLGMTAWLGALGVAVAYDRLLPGGT